MTGRTHDLAALTTLTGYIAAQPILTISLATGAVTMAANIAGALTPDIDQPTAPLWHKIPAGSIFGKIICPLLGSHRMLSHSLLGLFLAGWGMKILLAYIHTFLLTDMTVVWWAFIFGYLSHLIMDSLTKEGVPWLFPIPVRFGFPPFKFLRFTTDSWGEKLIVFPGLVLLNAVVIYYNYNKFADFASRHIVK
jgi:inner membrane protein